MCKSCLVCLKLHHTFVTECPRLYSTHLVQQSERASCIKSIRIHCTVFQYNLGHSVTNTREFSRFRVFILALLWYFFLSDLFFFRVWLFTKVSKRIYLSRTRLYIKLFLIKNQHLDQISALYCSSTRAFIWQLNGPQCLDDDAAAAAAAAVREDVHSFHFHSFLYCQQMSKRIRRYIWLKHITIMLLGM